MLEKKKFIFFLLVLFSLVSSFLSNPTEIDITEEGPFTPSQTENHLYKFQLKTAETEKKYLEVLVTPSDESNSLSTFMSYNNELPSRANFNFVSYKEKVNKIVFPLSNLVDKHFYISVICDNIPCEISFNFKYTEGIILKKEESFSFLAADSYREFDAIIYREESVSNYMNIFTIGSKEDDATLTLSYVEGSSNSIPIKVYEKALFNGDIAIVNETNYTYSEGAYYHLKVKAEPNTYVTIGSIILDKEYFTVKPNSKAIYGFVHKKLTPVKHICYKIDKEINEDTNPLVSFNLITRSKNIEVLLVNDLDEDKWSTPGVTDENKKTIIKMQEDIAISDIERKNYPYICIRPFVGEGFSFTIQINEISEYKKTRDDIEPLINGVTYNRWLTNGVIQYYRRYKHSNPNKPTKFTVRTLYGFPELYVHKCTIFPHCDYTKEFIEELKEKNKINSILEVSGVSTYTVIPEEGENLLSGEQNLLIVRCNNSNGCKVQISFFDEEDNLVLRPFQRYTQAITANHTEHIQIDVSEKTAETLLIFLHTISGQTNINIRKTTGQAVLNNDTYFGGNTELFKFTRREDHEKAGCDLIGTYIIDISTASGAYYGVNYEIKYDSSDPALYHEMGYMVLQTLLEGKTKSYSVTPRNREQNSPFYINFYPINCEIKATFKNSEQVLKSNNYGFIQFAITPDDSHYIDETFSFETEISKFDHETAYPNEVCKYYLSSEELYVENELVINEATKVKLEINKKTPNVVLLFPYAGKPQDINIYFNVLSLGRINVSLLLNGKEFKKDVFSRDKLLTILSREIESCGLAFCSIHINITADDESFLEEGIIFEALVSTQSKVASYIPKESLITDTVYCDSRRYYITDVSPNEAGEILVNFNRGGGKMIARLVEKNKIEEGADWNSRVILPNETTTQDLLQSYNPFTKSLIYTKEDTKKCERGCDLIIAIINNDEYREEGTSRKMLNSFNLIIHKTDGDKNSNNILIPFDEYVFGTLTAVEEYDYYYIIIPYETNEINFELQGLTSSLYMNFGSEKPTKESNHYKLESNSKNQIGVVTRENNEHFPKQIKNTIITIGVNAAKIDLVTFYTFRVISPKSNFPKILRIGSDQSSLCETKEKKSYCFFLIPQDYNDYNDLFLYSYSDDYTDLTLYVNLVKESEFDKMSETEVLENLPKKEKSSISTELQFNKNVLMLNNEQIFEKGYILLSILSSNPSMINLLSSFRSSIQKLIPNPATDQLFVLPPKNKNIFLSIPGNDNYILHTISIYGKGKVRFYDQLQNFTLSGSNDFVALVTNKEEKVIEIINDANSEDFAFYFWYDVRPTNNFDEIFYGMSGISSYKNSQAEFPLNFYSRINFKDEDLAISILFNHFEYSETDENSDEDFIVTAMIVDSSDIIKKKNDKSYQPTGSTIKGHYSKIVRSGSILIPKEDIQKEGEKAEYIYITIEKQPTNLHKYKEIQVAVTVLADKNIENRIPINRYHHGYMKKGQDYPNIFILRKNQETDTLMKVEFSTSEKNLIDFALLTSVDSNEVDYYHNSTGLEIKSVKENGKATVTVPFLDEKKNVNQVYLSVFYNGNSEHKVDTEEKKTNYMFKYETTKDDFDTHYFIPKEKSVVAEYEKNIKTKITKVTYEIESVKKDEASKKPILAKYYVRTFSNTTFNEEGTEVLNTIAISNLNPDYLNVTESKESKFSIEIPNMPVNTTYYASVIAIIEETKDIFAYDAIKFEIISSGSEDPKKPSTFPGWLIALIVVIAFLVLGGIVFFILRFKKKTSGAIEETAFIEKEEKGDIVAPV